MDRKQRQQYIGKRVQNEHGKIGVIVDVFETGSAHVEFLDWSGDDDYGILVLPVTQLEYIGQSEMQVTFNRPALPSQEAE